MEKYHEIFTKALWFNDKNNDYRSIKKIQRLSTYAASFLIFWLIPQDVCAYDTYTYLFTTTKRAHTYTQYVPYSVQLRDKCYALCGGTVK